jgi:hypothetical protein
MPKMVHVPIMDAIQPKLLIVGGVEALGRLISWQEIPFKGTLPSSRKHPFP